MATFTNQATLLYNGITANSNIVTGEVVQLLTLWKDSSVDSYQYGDIITYVISIQNTGTTPFDGLTLTDNLGAYEFGGTTRVPLTYTGDPVLYYLNGVRQSAPSVTAGPPLVISGINVPAGQGAVIIYRTMANTFAPLVTGGEINNTVTMNGGGLSGPITATETVTFQPDAFLTITKSLSPQTVTENGQISYTLTIQNFGAEEVTAAANTIISDDFDPIINNLSVTANGNPLTPSVDYTYNTSSGQFTTIAGKITVPAATFPRDPVTGAYSIVPGVTTLVLTGTI